MSKGSLKSGPRRLGGHLLVALIVFALVPTAPGLASVSASTSTSVAPSAFASGVRVPDPGTEPDGSQSVNEHRYVAPTAPPATDVGVRSLRAAGPGTYTCEGYLEIDTPNPPSALMNDVYTWGNFPPVKVGNGAGDINWRLNPYQNPSWYMWLHSLRWLGQGITAGGQGNLAILEHVSTIVHDWVHDNPFSWKGDIGAWESTMHRANVLVCLRHAVLAGYGVSTLPARYAWLDASLNDHARFLIENWGGAWNHGTDESIILFGVGCILGNSSYFDLKKS